MNNTPLTVPVGDHGLLDPEVIANSDFIIFESGDPDRATWVLRDQRDKSAKRDFPFFNFPAALSGMQMRVATSETTFIGHDSRLSMFGEPGYFATVFDMAPLVKAVAAA